MDATTPFEAALAAIRAKDAASLRELLAADDGLATAVDADGGTLLGACQSYANFAGDDPGFWTAPECAEALLDAGVTVRAEHAERALETCSVAMTELFAARGILPDDLRTAAATGNTDRARELARGSDDKLAIADSVRFAALYEREETLRALTERAVELEPHLALDAEELADFLLVRRQQLELKAHLSTDQLLRRVRLAEAQSDGDTTAFRAMLTEEPTLLSSENATFQIRVLEGCAYSKGTAIAKALLDEGASVNDEPRPESKATQYAIEYGDRDMLALLAPLWPAEHDLATRAGLGDLEAVKAFFGAGAGGPAPEAPDDEELLRALALSLMNEQLEVAAFLLDRGADIDGRWGTHEPASILHETAANGKAEAVRFLVDRGADLTLRDERYEALAVEWASFCGQPDIEAYLRPLTDAALGE